MDSEIDKRDFCASCECVLRRLVTQIGENSMVFRATERMEVISGKEFTTNGLSGLVQSDVLARFNELIVWSN